MRTDDRRAAGALAFQLHHNSRMPHPRWLALCALVLTGCGNPHEKAGRALHQAKGWAATAEAVTSDPLGRGLPPYFVARTLAIGADAVGQHAQTIESLGDLSEPERRSSADLGVTRGARAIERSVSGGPRQRLRCSHGESPDLPAVTP